MVGFEIATVRSPQKSDLFVFTKKGYIVYIVSLLRVFVSSQESNELMLINLLRIFQGLFIKSI